LSQQLVAAGETVLDVPATLASRVRVLGTGQSTKTDANDARSVAVAALHAPALAVVRPADHVTVCRLPAKHHTDVARWRTKQCCRLHALVAELVPGDIDKEVVVTQARSLLERIEPQDVAAVERHRQAVELVDDIEHLDVVGKDSRARITAAVAASGTTLTDVFGIGPIVAAMLIGFSGDPLRFTTASRYAAYTGTAPIEFSSGGRIVHRLSRRGNRRLNHALHCAAITRSGTATAPAAATTNTSSLKARPRAKRSVPSNAGSATSPGGTSSPTPDASPTDDKRVRAGHSSNVSVACVTGSHLNTGSSAQSLPEPSTHPTTTGHTDRPVTAARAPTATGIALLTTERFSFGACSTGP
jgi:transposase